MEEKKYERFLPLGTVVMLKNGKLPVMIIGYSIAMKDNNKIYDYNATFFPMGTIDTTIVTPFNHDQITEVLFLGYENDNSRDYLNKLKQFDIAMRKDKIINTEYKGE